MGSTCVPYLVGRTLTRFRVYHTYVTRRTGRFLSVIINTHLYKLTYIYSYLLFHIYYLVRQIYCVDNITSQFAKHIFKTIC